MIIVFVTCCDGLIVMIGITPCITLRWPEVAVCGWCGRRVPNWSPFDTDARECEEDLGYYICYEDCFEREYSCYDLHYWRDRRRADYFFLALSAVLCRRRNGVWRRVEYVDSEEIDLILHFIAPFL